MNLGEAPDISCLRRLRLRAEADHGPRSDRATAFKKREPCACSDTHRRRRGQPKDDFGVDPRQYPVTFYGPHFASISLRAISAT